MNPPSIGDGLSAGWNTLKANPGGLAVPFLCALVLGFIPVVGGFLALPGLMLVSLKALRGETPEPKDGFVGFEAIVDNLILGVLQIVGLIACCVGVYVTQALFIPGTCLVVDKRMGWSDAKDKCMEAIWPNILPWTIYTLVMGLVATAGILACVVGIVVTLPIASIGLAYAYEQTLSRS